MTKEKQLRVIVPEDWDNNQRGSFFESIVSDLIRKQRFRVQERIQWTGMEIDVLADSLDTEERRFIECKFEKDPLGAGVITELIGKAVIKRAQSAYLFSTAPPGKQAKGTLDEIEKQPPKNAPAFAFIGPQKLVEWFIDVKNIEIPCDIQTLQAENTMGTLTLVVLPDDHLYWVMEEKRDGFPFRAHVFPAIEKLKVDIEWLKGHFSSSKLWEGLEFIDSSKIRSEPKGTHGALLHIEDEIITSITTADSIDDYKPCRPSDFVGRYELQKKVLEFLHFVRDDKTDTRILCFVGPSGFGKSSMLVKLSDLFKKTRWKNKFHLFPIDVRPAKGPLFVAKAFQTGIQRAIDSGFIDLPGHKISIESTESFWSSPSILAALETLKNARKVLVIFFDQFEELFTKDSLSSVFTAFERAAFGIDSLQSTIVLGFCWRTGITFSGEHSAYHAWHSLKDKRKEIPYNAPGN